MENFILGDLGGVAALDTQNLTYTGTVNALSLALTLFLNLQEGQVRRIHFLFKITVQ